MRQCLCMCATHLLPRDLEEFSFVYISVYLRMQVDMQYYKCNVSVSFSNLSTL